MKRAFTLLLTAVIFIIGCKEHREFETTGLGSFKPSTIDTPYKEVIVWKNPDVDSATFNRWYADKKKEIADSGGTVTEVMCAACGGDLYLLRIPNATGKINQAVGGGNGGSGSGGHTTGGDGPAYYCSNVALNSRAGEFPNDTSLYPQESASNPTDSGSLVPTIAVFDTGLDTGYIRNNFVKGSGTSCLGPEGKAFGWNFVSNTSNTLDDHPIRHGTVVTTLIVKQIANSPGHSVNILPVKVFDSTGNGSLFNILCAFAYAQKAGANIINASFGFYASDTSVIFRVFKKYTFHYLTQNHILLVASAGNYDPTEAGTTSSGAPLANVRNLDTNLFFPACFSKDHEMNNIIVATTIDSLSDNYSANQNYSSDIVDVGVHRDTLDPQRNYYFWNPIKSPNNDTLYTVTGSSFATPIVTGKIGLEFRNLRVLTRDSILAHFQNMKVFLTHTQLGLYVKNGFFTIK